MSYTVVKSLRQAAFGALAILAVAGSAKAVDITGAGATFPNPVGLIRSGGSAVVAIP